MNELVRRIGLYVGTAAVGVAVGYFLSPTKTITQTKVVEKEKLVREENRRETTKFDATTGKVTEKIVETGTKNTSVNSQKRERYRETERSRPTYAVKVGFSTNPRANLDSIVRVGGEVNLQLFNLWGGIDIDLSPKRPQFGPYLRMEF
jgi:hypothetical protein